MHSLIGRGTPPRRGSFQRSDQKRGLRVAGDQDWCTKGWLWRRSRRSGRRQTNQGLVTAQMLIATPFADFFLRLNRTTNEIRRDEARPQGEHFAPRLKSTEQTKRAEERRPGRNECFTGDRSRVCGDVRSKVLNGLSSRCRKAPMIIMGGSGAEIDAPASFDRCAARFRLDPAFAMNAAMYAAELARVRRRSACCSEGRTFAIVDASGECGAAIREHGDRWRNL